MNKKQMIVEIEDLRKIVGYEDCNMCLGTLLREVNENNSTQEQHEDKIEILSDQIKSLAKTLRLKEEITKASPEKREYIKLD